MISYNKLFNKNVIENLEILLSQEFRNTKIRYDDNFKGKSFFVLKPQRDDIVELRTNGSIRQYTIDIIYYMKDVGVYNKQRSLDNRIDTVERLKELLRTNTASIEEFLYFIDSDGKDFLTSDTENLVILKRPILITSQEQFFITSDGRSFSVFPPLHTYQWHDATIESVNYETISSNPSYLLASMEFKCLVEEVYA